MATLPVDFTNFKPTSICNNNNVHIIYQLTNNPKYQTTCRYYHSNTGCRYGSICYFSHMDFISILPKETLANILHTTHQNPEQKLPTPTNNPQQTPTTLPYNMTSPKTHQQPYYTNLFQQTVMDNFKILSEKILKLKQDIYAALKTALTTYIDESIDIISPSPQCTQTQPMENNNKNNISINEPNIKAIIKSDNNNNNNNKNIKKENIKKK
eukprot:364963_1